MILKSNAHERPQLLVHPSGRPVDSKVLGLGKGVEKGVLTVPGQAFMPLGGATPYIRVSFSLIEEDKAEEAFRRLREVVLAARAEG